MKDNLWKFGTREVVYSAIGAALYGVLSWATNILALPAAGNISLRPAVAIPMFFGVAFGPLVGFLSGFVGNLLGDSLTGWGFYWNWCLGNGLMGMVPRSDCWRYHQLQRSGHLDQSRDLFNSRLCRWHAVRFSHREIHQWSRLEHHLDRLLYPCIYYRCRQWCHIGTDPDGGLRRCRLSIWPISKLISMGGCVIQPPFSSLTRMPYAGCLAI